MFNTTRFSNISEYLTHTEQELVYESYIKNEKIYNDKKTTLPNYFKFHNVEIPFSILEKKLKTIFQSFNPLSTDYLNSKSKYLDCFKKIYHGVDSNSTSNIIIQFYIERYNKSDLSVIKESYVFTPKPLYNDEIDEQIEFCSAIDFIIPPIDEKHLQSLQAKISNLLYSLINEENDFSVKKETKLHIIEHNSETGYELIEFNVNTDNDEKIDKELLYGKGFNEFYDLFIKKLNNTKKGIAIFNGPPGTGKSSFIRSLIKEGKLEDKIVTYAPIDIMLNLTNTSIINFLKKLKNRFGKKKNLLLICEDGEQLLLKRDKIHSNDGISSILNFTDGLLNDFFNIQIIITHNQENEVIDDALLRKGRLIAIKEFNKLSTQDSEKLLDYLNINEEAKEPMSLSQIFHLKEEYNIENDKILYQGIKIKNKTGFNV